MKAVAVIPAYNEEGTIARWSVSPKLPDLTDVIVVSDGSTTVQPKWLPKPGPKSSSCRRTRGKEQRCLPG